MATPQRVGADSPPASSAGLAPDRSSCALALLDLFMTAAPPAAVAAPVPTASTAYAAHSDSHRVWLVLEQYLGGSDVHDHADPNPEPESSPNPEALTLTQEP